MINSKDIKDLHPTVQDMCNKFINACAAQGIKVIITATYRDNEYQNQLYAQGRTKPGEIVTDAKGGQSIHNYRLAFDFAPETNGNIDWNDLDLFNKCGQIGKSVGLEWGGDWTSIKDRPHLQYTNGLTLADLQSGKMI